MQSSSHLNTMSVCKNIVIPSYRKARIITMTTTSLRSRPFAQVDVFTDRALLGNPLAVVLDGYGLDDAAMQKFANWTNLSETTFAFPPTDPTVADYKVRIFTTNSELPFAGHPTLGTCAALLASGQVRARENGLVIQECAVGLVEVLSDVTSGRLSFKAPRLRSLSTPVDASVVLPMLHLGDGDVPSLRPLRMDIGIRWLIVPLPSQQLLHSLQVTGEALQHITTSAVCDGVTFFAPSPQERAEASDARNYDVELRTFFAPGGVVVEDPVCGSANACVARYLQDVGAGPWVDVGNGGIVSSGSSYVAAQGSRLGRDGRIFITYREGSDGVVDPWVGGYVTQLISGVATL